MQSDVIMAQADRLAAEIALERAKAKAPAKEKAVLDQTAVHPGAPKNFSFWLGFFR
jgi:hypothetical protein